MLLPIALALTLSAADAADAPCAPGRAVALDGIGTPQDELLRAAELVGAAPPTPRVILRGGAHEETLCASGAPLPWTLASVPPPGPDLRLRGVPVRLTSVFNSRYPSGADDGLLAAGRGVSGVLSGGIAVRWRFVSAALAPELSASANEPFDTIGIGPGAPRYANPYYGDGIDLPQRFGSEPFSAWSLGQSYLRADVANVGLGLSTENLWFGPGVRNNLLMSNAAPGFPHVFVGTSRPADVWIGDAEAFVFWGRLSRSEEFADRSRPLVSGLVVDLAPRFAPTLTLGLARVFVQKYELSARTLLAGLQPFEKNALPGDNPDDNQLASVFARWVFPASGFEVYGEWGREDHEWDLNDFLREPDHTQAYLLGLQKVWRTGPRWVRLQAELVHLQEQRPLANERGVPVWYTHGANLGYTHEGQLLGAWVGPGADAQTIAVDVFHGGGRIGGFVERVRRNDAYYWAVVEPVARGQHDVELTGGARGLLLSRRVELTWEAAAAYRWNRDFRWSEPNFRLGVSLAVPVP